MLIIEEIGREAFKNSLYYFYNFSVNLNYSKIGHPWWVSGKKSTCNAGDMCLIPGLGRFPGEGNGNLPQYSCLGNPMARGTWWAIVHRVAKSQTRLSD